MSPPGYHSEGTVVRTKTIKDELGNIASTAQERINLFADRLERVHQTPEYVGFEDTFNKTVQLSKLTPSPNTWSLKRATLHLF